MPFCILIVSGALTKYKPGIMPTLAEPKLFTGAFRLDQHPDYKETALLDRLRAVDYNHLDESGQTYLDYTGGNVFAQSQLDEHMSLLRNRVWGNPHSVNPTSKLATEHVEATRAHVLNFFNAADDYFCVFTNNASGALKIVGENYKWQQDSRYLLAFDNHNSVNGIREYDREHGARTTYIPLLYQTLRLDEAALASKLAQKPAGIPCLFALPAQSNVSGVKHPLALVQAAQDQGWDVLLDSAAFVPTSRLDLKAVQPDFVSVSFYKIFGYPTGIGALLIKKTSFNKLQKHWFAGGTVQFVSVTEQKHYLISNHERYEDGTLDYLGIPAVSIGLRHIELVGLETIGKRVQVLTDWLLRSLQGLRYPNGRPMVHVFGPTDTANRGGTIIFNMFDSKGQTIPYMEVEEEAIKRQISLRTGCFCNPGIDEVNSCVSTDEFAMYFSGVGSMSFADIRNYFGRLRGAIRISVGIATVARDVEKFIVFLEEFAGSRQEEPI
jgi:selenocysteine lyase/cysteine desulfurase